MKLAIISAVVIFSVNSFACDQLVGAWDCKNSDGKSVIENYTLVPNGIQIIAVELDGSVSSPMIMDEKEHTMDVEGEKTTYTGNVNCNGNQVLIDFKYKSDVMDDSNKAVGTAVGTNKVLMIINGNNRQVNSTDNVTLPPLDGQPNVQKISDSYSCTRK
jgi:hypothetical protein